MVLETAAQAPAAYCQHHFHSCASVLPHSMAVDDASRALSTVVKSSNGVYLQ
jgi:hypothetical protein